MFPYKRADLTRLEIYDSGKSWTQLSLVSSTDEGWLSLQTGAVVSTCPCSPLGGTAWYEWNSNGNANQRSTVWLREAKSVSGKAFNGSSRLSCCSNVSVRKGKNRLTLRSLIALHSQQLKNNPKISVCMSTLKNSLVRLFVATSVQPGCSETTARRPGSAEWGGVTASSRPPSRSVCFPPESQELNRESSVSAGLSLCGFHSKLLVQPMDNVWDERAWDGELFAVCLRLFLRMN